MHSPEDTLHSRSVTGSRVGPGVQASGGPDHKGWHHHLHTLLVSPLHQPRIIQFRKVRTVRRQSSLVDPLLFHASSCNRANQLLWTHCFVHDNGHGRSRQNESRHAFSAKTIVTITQDWANVRTSSVSGRQWRQLLPLLAEHQPLAGPKPSGPWHLRARRPKHQG